MVVLGYIGCLGIVCIIFFVIRKDTAWKHNCFNRWILHVRFTTECLEFNVSWGKREGGNIILLAKVDSLSISSFPIYYTLVDVCPLTVA